MMLSARVLLHNAMLQKTVEDDIHRCAWRCSASPSCLALVYGEAKQDCRCSWARMD